MTETTVQLSFKELWSRYGDRCNSRENRRHWETSLKMSDRKLGQFVRAIVKYHGTVTDTYVVQPATTPGRTVVFMAISLPAGCREEFEWEADVALREPPAITLEKEAT